MTVRRVTPVPVPDGLGLIPPPGFLLERHRVEVGSDPRHPANQGVPGLAEAAADGGEARAAVDVQLLLPADRRPASLLVEVVNRGQAAHVPFDGFAVTAGASTVTGPPVPDLDARALALREGGAVAWCGWQWDLSADPRLLAATVPEVPDDVHHGHPPATVDLSTPAPTESLDLDSPYAVDPADETVALTERRADGTGPRTVPRGRWWFVRDPSGTLRIRCADGFEPGRTYRLAYRTDRCPVTGAAMLAVRDVVEFLRAARPGNPCLAAPPASVLGYGISQSGRFLRQFLAEGRNAGERGERIFDGLLVHAAGGLGSDVTSLHARPSLPPPDAAPGGPFANRDLLADSPPGAAPRVLFTNTATEYWRGDAALTHLDPGTRTDLPEVPEVRHYSFGGLDHYGTRRPPGADVLFPVNDADAGLLLRAAYRNLLRWIVDGVAPPASAVPRFDDGSAEFREAVLDRIASRLGLRHLPLPRPAGTSPVVSAVGNDLNEVAGVLLPEVVLSGAVLTGWNPRAPRDGIAPSFAPRIGARIPRPDEPGPVEARCREVAEDLVRRGFLLAEDVAECVRRALSAER